MSFIGRIRNRVRAAAARPRLEREMQEEMRAHIAQAAERFRARGMEEQEALLSARREFGNVGVVQEEARDARGARWIESVIGDLRHAARHFARTPVMAGTIVLILTLGIGVSAAAFAIVSGILTRPAPGVPADERLVTIRGIQVDDGRRYARGVSYPELMEYAHLPAFADVAGWATSMVVIEFAGQEAGTALAHFVTPNFFRTLGLRVSPGTAFAQSRFDDHAVPELTAIIGHLYAIDKFGVAEAAVGKMLKVNGVNVVIIGVAPPRFIAALGDRDARTLWLPVSAWPLIDRLNGDTFTNRADASFFTAARLRDGVSLRQAMPAVELVASRAANALPRRTSGKPRQFAADVAPLRGDVRIESSSSGNIQTVSLITGLVLLILLVCTTTVSSLLVGGAVARRHEIAVRLALGASRARIVRQLLTESALLAFAAGVAGLAVYVVICRGLRGSITDLDIDPTWATALATALFAMATSIICGLSPALHATRDGVSGALKDSSGNTTVKARLQRVFVVAQIALTQPLLVGLAMMIAIVAREANRGATRTLAEHVVLAEFDNWSAASRADNRMPAVIERLSALPGVVKVIPQVTGYRILKVEAPATGASAARRFSIRTHLIPPGYFQGMDVPLRRGREFMWSDTTVAVTPIVIGSDFAAQAFGNADPVGKRLAALTWEGTQRIGEFEVVGVVAVADIGSSEFGSGIRVFTPMGGPFAVPNSKPDALLIRTRTPAAPLISTFQEIARAEAPMMPARTMKTLGQIDRDTRSEIIEATGASAAGGIIALFLASIGLYAVVALSVSQRRREIGVRVALGAQPRQVVAMFFRNGLRVSLIGLLIGLPLSAAALKILGSQVGVPRTNMPAIAAAVALAVVVVASLASWIPARRAAGVDPLVALRDG